MIARIATLIALALCGCTQGNVVAQSNSPMPVGVYQPGESTRVGDCPYVVEFPGPPKSNTEKSKFTPANVDRTLGMTYETPTMTYAANCGCSDNTRFGDITRVEALSWTENSAKQLEIKLVDAHYEDSEMGKVVEFYGGMPSTQGPLKVEGRRYYFGQCSVGVFVVGKVGTYDGDRANGFLRSTKRVDITPAWAAPSPVADRLQALKDLLDRKVITPDEYAAKRKEILKSL